MPKRYKIFIDSSALIAGLNSPSGSAGIIISAFLAGEFYILVSNQVIEEVERNIQAKFPLLRERFLSFLISKPQIVEQPSIKAIRKAYKIIQTEDAPILAAALKCKPDFLVTWDKKHFLRKEILLYSPFIVCTPQEFLQKYWERSRYFFSP